MAQQRAQQVLYVTERCVLRLTGEGLEVIEIAPGIDLTKDVLEQAEFPLIVSPDLKPMDPAIFSESPFGLQLKEAHRG